MLFPRTLFLFSSTLFPLLFLVGCPPDIDGKSGASSSKGGDSLPLLAGKTAEGAAEWDGSGEQVIALRAATDSSASVGFFLLPFESKGSYTLVMNSWTGIDDDKESVEMILSSDSSFVPEQAVDLLTGIEEETGWTFEIAEVGSYFLRVTHFSRQAVSSRWKRLGPE